MCKVYVMLSAYNGEKYISEQIDSIMDQQNVNVFLYIRDDGSTDETLAVLNKYSPNVDVHIIKGENIGYASSFMELVNACPLEDDAYYAFADQDDYWLPKKLMVAVNMIKNEGNIKPIIYASSLQRVDENLQFLPKQKYKNLVLSLGGEFSRHRLAGCTYVFNACLMKSMKKIYGNLPKYSSHDGIAAMICLAVGGEIVYDKNSYILFRRHGNNTSIDSKGIKIRIKKEVERIKNNKVTLKNKILAEWLISNFSNYELDYHFLQLISEYRHNTKKMLSLLVSEKIDSGFWYYNILLRLLILFRWY